MRTLDQGSPGADDMPAYRRLRENIATLWDFLHSGRYTGEPRHIAYAIAAVPELTWRSSLDRFTASPSRQPIQIQAFADHIRRSRPALYASLQQQGPTRENLRKLRTHCLDCKRLAKSPKHVTAALGFAR